MWFGERNSSFLQGHRRRRPPLGLKAAPAPGSGRLCLLLRSLQRQREEVRARRRRVFVGASERQWRSLGRRATEHCRNRADVSGAAFVSAMPSFSGSLVRLLVFGGWTAFALAGAKASGKGGESTEKKDALPEGFRDGPLESPESVEAMYAELMRRISPCRLFHDAEEKCLSLGRCVFLPLPPNENSAEGGSSFSSNKNDAPPGGEGSSSQQRGVCVLDINYLKNLANTNCAFEPRSTLLSVAADLQELVSWCYLHARRPRPNPLCASDGCWLHAS